MLEDSEEILVSHALFAATLQASTCHHAVCGGGGGLACVGVRRTLAQFGDAKQAMGEGKSDPVETGLTGSAATALCICDQLNV